LMSLVVLDLGTLMFISMFDLMSVYLSPLVYESKHLFYF
jgi:hypothetical protein